MEKKGWIYYRNKPTGTGYGNALQELNKIMNPSIKNVRELQEEQKNNQKDKDKDKDLIEFK